MRRPGLRSLLLMLGGGIFVVAGIAAARVVVRRVREREIASATAPPAGPATEWVSMPPGSVPAVEAPPLSPSEQVVPHARDAEEVVESLVPPELHASPQDRRVDLVIAVVVIIVAVIAVFAIVWFR